MHLLLFLLLQLGADQAMPERQLTVRWLPQRPVQGQLVVIQVEGALPGDRVSGTLGEKKIRFFIDARNRVRALSAVGLNVPPGSLPLTVQVTPEDGDPVIAGVAVQVEAGVFEEQELRVDPKYVKPPRKVRSRIRREREEMSRIWRRKPTARKWKGDFVWPRKDEICSSFGLRRTFNGKLKSRHYGVDIDGKVGSPLVALGAGRVVMVSNRYYAGGTVVIDHGLRLFSLYFHMSKFAVKEGDLVARGQPIGEVGRSGRVTGPHVHLSTKVEGISFDPLSLLAFGFTEEDPAEGP